MRFYRFTGLFLLAGLLSACGGETQMPGDPATSPQDQDALYEWLVQEEAATSAAMRVDVTQHDLDAIYDNDEPRLAVGVSKPLGATIDFSAVLPTDLASTRPFANGAIRGTGTGFVWTGVVESAGAAAMRLGFVDFSLPEGASLYLYDDSGEVFGPYTARGPMGSGTFWSNTLDSERVYLQLRYDGPDRVDALQKTRMVLSEVGHIAPRFVDYRGRPSNLCKYNASCVLDAAEAEVAGLIPPEILPYRDAAASYLLEENGTWYICSGGLIADYTPDANGPYFLTANHCVSSDEVANSVEAFFHYSTDEGGLCDAWPPGRIIGADLVVHSEYGDYSLLDLWEDAPAGTVALPWTTVPVADGDMLYRISHPQGAPQAFSSHRVDLSTETWCEVYGLTPLNFIYSQDVLGATEGGSSGSPVLNANGEIVGQLYGGCGSRLSNDCDYINNRTVDGELASYWTAFTDALGIPGEPEPDCTDDPDCDDGNVCNGAETCDNGTCASGTTLACDDGDACTEDLCDPVDGCDYTTPVVCDDGDACNGEETCNSATGCESGTPVTCDDGNACTDNACDPNTGGCIYDPITCTDGDPCTDDLCDPYGGCYFDPIDGCEPPACGDPGDTCSSGGDCCSGRCHPVLGTCK